jgi:malonyl-CoA O-methyltransferase
MSDENQCAQLLEPAAAYERWARNYPPHAHNPLMQAEERAMLLLLPADLRGCAILDAGCGSGRYMIHALRRGASRVVGVDLSAEMLNRARAELGHERSSADRVQPSAQRAMADLQLIRGKIEALPLRTSWADLKRVTRPGGAILCSDFHPIGHTLGWRREFSADGHRYAVYHTAHPYSAWQQACGALGLRIAKVLEPRLDPADIPGDARFDPVALKVPVAIVFELSDAAETSARGEPGA